MQMQTDSWLDIAGKVGPWVLSAAALLQVWVLEAWRHLRKGAVDILPSGTTEVGFSVFGPTIGVHGTLVALHRSVFVEAIYVEVIRAKDGAHHDLGWRAIRPTTLKLSGDPIAEIELPSSFLLRPEEPYRFNILFNDADFVADVSPMVAPLPGLWHQYREQRLSAPGAKGVSLELSGNVDALAEDIFKEFAQEAAAHDAWNRLNQQFYWLAGRYEIRLVVRCRRPDQEFTLSWSIELEEDDSDALRSNSVAVVRNTCGLPAYFHFAQVSVEEEEA